ncbi:amino acid ABC transporter substrate-binding protein [Nitratifractor sp.]|uniref:amino acid ABC transporter substrate-binding protein n=1 Tax=Nitratifractor sp. TaxID=2268144 RepID=UPI0025D93661|nr:amino acid ABC transporter substrate-binding protein [Nitratifractor sp.]
MMKRLLKLSAVAALATATLATAGTLDDVKKAGVLKCGVNTGLPGFSEADSKGTWRGLDVDYCRALAAVVLGDASKVKFVPLNAKERFTALQSGEIDVLSRNTTDTETRDTALGINFTGVMYYDGQGFMVPKSLGVKSAKELDGATVCIQAGTTTELNLADYFRANGMKFKAITFDTNDQVTKAFEAGRCDVLTTDASGLYATRTKLKDPAKYVVLPEIISKEPLAPAVRHGDDQWFDIAKWTRNALLTAEEKGLTMANVDDAKAKSTDPEVKRLLSVEGEMCKNVGLEKGCFYNAIKQVGNYGEIFERNVGVKTPLKIQRGLNALWTKGGLQYSPPFR